MERRRWSLALAALLVLPGVVTAVHGPGVCSPGRTEIELACNPAAAIVTMDGTPARDEFRYCVPRYCSVPLVAYGTATPIAPVNWNGEQVVAKGDAVRITCDPGYMLAGTASAQPTCVDGCQFEAMDTCVPVKCREPFQDPNGVLTGGPMAALANRAGKCGAGNTPAAAHIQHALQMPFLINGTGKGIHLLLEFVCIVAVVKDHHGSPVQVAAAQAVFGLTQPCEPHLQAVQHSAQ
jgi:hypothetical protein